VFDNEYRVALCHKAVEGFKEQRYIEPVEACGGFIEYIEGVPTTSQM
jgi:hypothetical protein